MSAVMIRPSGWSLSNEVPESWRQAGHYYRGMSEGEYQAQLSSRFIRSAGRHSLRVGGTEFTVQPEDAEQYANADGFSPLDTLRPTYVIEIHPHLIPFEQVNQSDYRATQPIPIQHMTRSWKCYAQNGAIVAMQVWQE